MSISQRIKQLRRLKNKSQVEFSREIGASQTAISNYESGEREPNSEFLKKLVVAYDVNLSWLLTGEGSMFQEVRQIDTAMLTRTIPIPFVGEIAAGMPSEALFEEPFPMIDVPASLLSYPPPYILFRVAGNSMAPLMMPGDLVICSEDWRGVDIDGKSMAFRTPDGITIKKLREDYARKTTWLIPINNEYAPIPYCEDDEEIVMIGIVDLIIHRANREK